MGVGLGVLVFVYVGAELMLLGFMSLLLAVTQEHISKICVPSKVADKMLPCRKVFVTEGTESLAVYKHAVNRALIADHLVLADDTKFNNLQKSYSRRLADDDDDGSGGKVYETAKNANATDTCSSKVCTFSRLFFDAFCMIVSTCFFLLV